MANNNAEMNSLVEEMTGLISKQDTAGLKTKLQTIQKEAKSQELVDFVVPLLFEPDDQAALSLVGCLVSVDATTYLKPVSRKVQQEAMIRACSEKPMAVSLPFLAVIVQQLNGTDVEVSSNATESLVACCRKLGPSLWDPAIDLVLSTWKQAWNGMTATNKTVNSTICVRCATAMMDLAAVHDTLMQRVIATGGTDLLLLAVKYEADPLLQMTSLDLLERLAVTQPMHPQRSQWLCSPSVLSPLLDMSGAHADAPDPILGGPALRVLSCICRLGQQHDNNNASNNDALLGFHKALQKFQGTGELDRLALVDAISSFASASPAALELVLNDPMTREGWLSLAVAQPKLKAVILTSVAMVIDPPKQNEQDNDNNNNDNNSSNLAMKLYAALGQTNSNDGNSTDVVLALAKSPLPETRLGAYNLMRAMANTPTGSQVLLTHPGFYVFLISREGETTKEGKEAKYAVVQAVMNSPVKGLLAADILQTLDRILKEGPHFVQPIRPDLMTE
ncbi:ATPase regulatory subunit 5 [Seminavis robusta]|uniref:ATPase regulatory subunit 5 n=1 Tax=Seminavis robusta TaxID=568900 RepID=A0A9N8HJL5_9STRA|nr:ATPase regulatory subunit 5 [Seminavis robusta]|eukprot:Sro698_g189160.1 ATPase regulatory subunit 5 (505) ;mRNA; r:8056-9570